MSRNREFARQVESAVNGVSGRVRHYADEASSVGNDLLERSRRVTGKLAKRTNGNGQRIRYMAEDVADEATYQYRKLRKQVRRNPGVAIGIAAAAIGTFLLIRHALRDDD
ncbi:MULTISPECIES: hypothetical protein [Luteibacter]|uniref:ElaB/YqjD/DUF883 family membrane-anchored ribosome-binding protein n=1 Tax=Luteibacter flocculans TaxID=2780091 RepID=A0ABY4T5N9_9GAMM|nr:MULTISPECIES: hypothetical protein [Luteibacter]URL58209.1 hypothetical protein IM816_16685 [Luteibacter flocculans]SFW74895.1 hypothetical protein SAMN02800691_3486 [Luteibacter sp. UNCMF366Tsu5.1]